MQKKLHKFELAALANLCPESAEEVSQFIVQKYFFCTFPNFFADNDTWYLARLKTNKFINRLDGFWPNYHHLLHVM